MPECTILLCATDAGGARNLAPLVQAAVRAGLEPLVATTARLSGVFDAAQPLVDASSIATDRRASQLITDSAAVAVVVGTARYAGPEHLLTAAAHEAGARSVAVLDEWFNYALRFRAKNGSLVLPDVIAAQDALAAREAAAEGLPAERIVVTGSPALAELTDAATRFSASPPPLPDSLAPYAGMPIVTFLSETHAGDYGAAPGERGPLGEFLGYTEDSVLAEVADALSSLGGQFVLVEKAHPAAGASDETPALAPGVTRVRLGAGELWPLLWHSRAVVGMRSMALLESRILGAPTVAFTFGATGAAATAVRLGLVELLPDKPALASWLRARVAGETPRPGVERFDFASADAAERVLTLALAEAVAP